ncbi:MAG: photosynthetic reaction center subunit H [Sphingomonas sp. 28-62-20]|uniref:photosynthetic reaction center subunit H n=1 Tax=unclassified Sphingomonas TaxID=196159 RepID=UPI000A0B5820|nr:photosynthetic reaction center subunit H [Sphingomonas sp.]OQW73531.1 MAG: photosynthetic reaction center subunit H [Proteobacteria bacterium ST_bin13]OYY77559.1 MAG: photosynthetic reaction center subunit H [Sphingomonas sp. 28-62-20]
MHLQVTQGIDVALIVLNAFFLFFLGLVIYLRREDRREGYPLEHELTGRLEGEGGLILTAPTKSFKLPFGHGTVTAPTKGREPVQVPGARKSDWFAGAPIEPTGNPLVDGVGPAAFAERAKRPDLDWEGHARIVPLSTAEGFFLERKDADPRGYAVVAYDGKKAGTVSDIWIDKADRMIRYLQVDTGARQVLMPMTVASVSRFRQTVTTTAITAAQFADAPAIEGTGVITLYEEERVQAYFGGGYLYATADRSEPLI